MIQRTPFALFAVLLACGNSLADDTADRLRAAATKHGESLVRVRATTSITIERLPGITRGARRTHEVSVGGLVVSKDGLVLLPGRALDPAAASYALLGTKANREVLSVQVVGKDGRIREAKWLGLDPKSGLAAVRVSAQGLAGLSPVKLQGEPAQLGDRLWVLSLTPEALGNKPRVEAARVSFVGDAVWGLSPQLPQSLGALVLNEAGTPIGMLGELPGQGSRGDLLRSDLLAISKAGYVLPGEALAKTIASPPKQAGRPKATRRARAWLGIKHQVVTPELAESLKLDVDVGVRIEALYEGPAKAAGLLVGDIFLKLDGDSLDLDPGESFDDIIEDYGVGATASFVVRRARKIKTVELELARSPVRPEDAERVRAAEVGLELRALTFFDRIAAGLAPKTPGAAVISLAPDGAGSRAGLQVGDLLLKAGGEPIQGLADLVRLLETPGAHEVSVRRKSEDLTLRVRR